NVLDCALAGAHDVLQLRHIPRGQLIAALYGAALGLTTIQVHENLTQNAGCSQQNLAALVHRVFEPGGNLHNNFHRREATLAIGDHTNTGDVADVHALQAHRRANTQTTCVVHVSTKDDFLGEQPSGAGHDEDEHRKSDQREKHGQSHSEL